MVAYCSAHIQDFLLEDHICTNNPLHKGMAAEEAPRAGLNAPVQAQRYPFTMMSVPSYQISNEYALF